MEKTYVLTESEYRELRQQINEIAPLVVPLLGMAGRFALKQGAKWLAKKGIKAAAKKGIQAAAKGAVKKGAKGLAQGGLKGFLSNVLTKNPQVGNMIQTLIGKNPQIGKLLSSTAGQMFLGSGNALDMLYKVASGAMTVGALANVINSFNGNRNSNGNSNANAAGNTTNVPRVHGHAGQLAV